MTAHRKGHYRCPGCGATFLVRAHFDAHIAIHPCCSAAMDAARAMAQVGAGIRIDQD